MHKMRLSVIVVNYNVKHFLEQCLHSVRAASRGLAVEVFVVDNSSVDGSCQMVRAKFPEVTLVENKENVGFSRANNQALRVAKGEYALLLNPDTVVEESTFRRCLEFMDAHPEAGGLGVKMIDGRGNFLPESKRALPTPAVAFYKIFGLSALFPRSSRFGRYHLGHLDPDQTHDVEVLSGAFMLLRQEALAKVGLLDEEYFMYGEDIDLSWRIVQGGYRNYYFPQTRIIHYKGESTKKGSINYVLVFYNAMIIFARKHFTRQNARFFALLIRGAIWFRAGLSIGKRLWDRTHLPALEGLLVGLGFWLLTPIWEARVFGAEGGGYPEAFWRVSVPLYCLSWVGSVWAAGGYQKPYHLARVARGAGWGVVFVLAWYSLLPEEWRFSRALVLLGGLWSLVALPLSRLALGRLLPGQYPLRSQRKPRLAVVGGPAEWARVSALLAEVSPRVEVVGAVLPRAAAAEEEAFDGPALGSLDQLEEAIRVHRLEELVFCASDLSSEQIISTMLRLGDSPVRFKIAPPESHSIIGSNSIEATGELYAVRQNPVGKTSNRARKRLLDLGVSVAFLLSSPILAFAIRENFGSFAKRCLDVILGKKTWVGYNQLPDNELKKLPHLRPGILTVAQAEHVSHEELLRRNMRYAQHYLPSNDLFVIFRHLKELRAGYGLPPQDTNQKS